LRLVARPVDADGNDCGNNDSEVRGVENEAEPIRLVARSGGLFLLLFAA
jgi:hypothetical protein